MFNQMPTSSQLAQHDAWLEEMRKEPTYPTASKSVRIRYHDAWLEETRKDPSQPLVEPAPIRAPSRLVSHVGTWLVSLGLRLQERYGAQVPPVRETSSFPTTG